MRAGGLFTSATVESGIGPPTLPFVGFGVAFLDFDNDTHLDLAMANGHVLDNAPLFRAGASTRSASCCSGNGGTVALRMSRGLRGRPYREKVGRGLAAGDVDNDGDLDLLVTNNGEAADLLINQAGMPTMRCWSVWRTKATGTRSARGSG